MKTKYTRADIDREVEFMRENNSKLMPLTEKDKMFLQVHEWLCQCEAAVFRASTENKRLRSMIDEGVHWGAPSDEEIFKVALEKYSSFRQSQLAQMCFRNGAEWMRVKMIKK